MGGQGSASPSRHEFGVVLVLSVCFGLVGLDRFIINPLFPVIAADLGLDYQDIGLVAAALALSWGVAALFMGRLADRAGVKAVLVPAVLSFSLLVGLTGMAVGLGSLLVVRGLMGLAEGTFVPAAIVATTRASKPTRVGLNVGILHMAAALFGLGLAPLLATRLLGVLPSWHWVFAVVAVPGLIMAFWVGRVLPPDPRPQPAAAERPGGALRQALGRRVAANAAAMACWLSVVATLGALLPSYLTDHLRLSLDQMGIVLSGLGVGGLVGMILVPGLGDRFGHRAVASLAAILKLLALGLIGLVGADVGLIFATLLVVGLAGAGVTAITVGPLTSRAVAPPVAATATGFVVGIGEIIGGALAPATAGFLATRYGIGIVPAFALGATAVGLLALGLGAGGMQRGQSRRSEPPAPAAARPLSP